MIDFDNLVGVKDTAFAVEYVLRRIHETKSETHTFLMNTKIDLMRIVNVLRENNVNFGIYWYRRIAVLVVQR